MGIVRHGTADANNAMEVRRRECQAVEVWRQFTHTGVSVIQILQRPWVRSCSTIRIQGEAYHEIASIPH